MRGRLGELATHFENGARGEITVVVAGADAKAAAVDVSELDAEIRAAMSSCRPIREIASELASRSGLPRRVVYARALALRDACS